MGIRKEREVKREWRQQQKERERSEDESIGKEWYRRESGLVVKALGILPVIVEIEKAEKEVWYINP